jgi:hypothetical protein
MPAIGRQGIGNGLANTPASPRHQRNFSFQIHFHKWAFRVRLPRKFRVM